MQWPHNCSKTGHPVGCPVLLLIENLYKQIRGFVKGFFTLGWGSGIIVLCKNKE